MEDRKRILIIILLAMIAFFLFRLNEWLNRNGDLEDPYEKTYVEVQSYAIEDPEFWLEKIGNKDLLLMDTSQIEDYNRRNFYQLDYLADIEHHQDILERSQLEELIKSVSQIPIELRYDSQGNVMDEAYYNCLIDNLNLKSLPQRIEVKYAIAVNRTVLKTFPTREPSYREKEDKNFDRFLETAIYPWEPLAIYSESADGEWYFGRMYNYLGWIPKEDVAIGDKGEIFDCINWEPFLVVIDRQVDLEGVILDMGVRLPLIEEEEGYRVLMPKRKQEGYLELVERELPLSNSFNKGYLPYTKGNIIKQAFKFLGEEYGWGGMNNTRDCSAFIMDIHRTFGLKLPRNSIQQGLDSIGKLYAKDDMPSASVLYMPGHIMLYLGEEEGIGYIIHQAAAYYEEGENGLEYIDVMKTVVTPLTIRTSSGRSYLESVVTCKEFVTN